MERKSWRKDGKVGSGGRRGSGWEKVELRERKKPEVELKFEPAESLGSDRLGAETTNARSGN